ncbi:nuclear transport factor 2 family protein [Nocardia sp. BSTN01]|uniref:nuclear transport factor 2 family protein n=1 Tax=Nocardia sp. BSTN01 TaxID=2783665 RepID=UPI0028151EED|nr:nuclear transport factor 2 family protein [Nocardia sp. BSTN01]
MTELAELHRRLARIEDERAIERMIASYGPLVDAGNVAAADLWSAEGTYDVEDWQMRGRADVAAMVGSDAHQGLIKRGCLHFHGPAVVTVDGDEAVAVCESVLVVAHNGRNVVARTGANHFTLRRIDGRWQITARTARTVDGDPAARELLTAGIEGVAR